MKLTIDARLIRSSGIGIYLQNIISTYLGDCFDLELLCHKEDNVFLNCFNEKKTFEAKLYSIKELLQTPLYTPNCDIFWSPHYNVPIVNYAKKLKVVTIHDVFHLAFFNTLSLKQKLYTKVLMHRAIFNSDIIFTVSHFSKREILKHFACDPEKIKVVYNGIDSKSFGHVYNENIIDQTLKQYHINTPYILFVGNVKPHKNLKTALIGFKEYLRSSNNTGLKFIIVGKRDGFITGDLGVFELLKDPLLNRSVIFTGWVRDEHLPIIYQGAKCFLFPSYYEGFGFPPLEAMAAGVPVISSDAACLPEIYGDAAYYFNPHDPQAIAESLDTVLSDGIVRQRLTEKGRIQALKYNWVDCTNQHVAFIKEKIL